MITNIEARFSTRTKKYLEIWGNHRRVSAQLVANPILFFKDRLWLQDVTLYSKIIRMLFRAYTKYHGARDEARQSILYANPYILSYLDIYVSISIYLETRLSISSAVFGYNVITTPNA